MFPSDANAKLLGCYDKFFYILLFIFRISSTKKKKKKKKKNQILIKAMQMPIATHIIDANH